MRRRPLVSGLVLGLALVAAGTTVLPQATAGPGPDPGLGGPLTRPQVVETTRLVADHWIAANPAAQGDNKWANCAFHSGVMALHRLTEDRKYYEHSLAWATEHQWSLAKNKKPPHWADHQCAGQVYLDLNEVEAAPERTAGIEQDVAAQVASGKTDYWTWVDALHMAMPILARLGVAKQDDSYLAQMDEMYRYTRDQAGGQGYFDPGKSLWWRDADFAGTDTYWSRGNGWALAALVKVLAALPADDPRRADYTATVREMAEALRARQRPDGFWNADLGGSKEFEGSETSGTAFFTYGLAWGVNNGVLDAATFRPVVEKAWQGMAGTAVHPDGLLGYVQNVGKQPSDNQPVGKDDTAVFGVGAFLLAGSEVARLVSPDPDTPDPTSPQPTSPEPTASEPEPTATSTPSSTALLP